MLTILRFLLSKSGWLVLSFLAIVAFLALWNVLPSKVRDWKSQAESAEQVAVLLTNGRPAFEQTVQSAVRDADGEIRRLRQASRVELERVQRDIERQRQTAQARILDDGKIAWVAATGDSETIIASIRAEYVELPLLDRTASFIQARRHNLDIGAARLALRLGGARQRSYLDRLALTAPTSLELGRNQPPLAPTARGRRDVAGLGFGYGLAATPATLAGAYTIFTNNGARVQPTLLARGPDATIERTSVFSPEVTRQVVTYMRSVVTDGTGRAADVPGLLVAGKTGTAEKLGSGAGYDESRNFSSFAGVFPANDPRYVIVLALDDTGEGAAGGMVAAPAVARTLRRIAPMLGLRVEPRESAR